MATWLTIIIISIIFSFLFSGIEIAYISANKLKIELDRKNNIFSARILSFFIRRPSDFVSTILLGNNIALVLYGMAMAILLEPVISLWLPAALRSDSIIMLLQTLISTLIILILAEFLPKTLFRLNPNRIMHFFALPLYVVYIVLFPLQILFVKLSELVIKRLFKVNFTQNAHHFGHVDLDHFLDGYEPTNEPQENITSEIQMIQNAIDFRNLKVRDCMIPRNEIAALEIDESIERLKETFITTGHSKVLIYRNTIDNIIGYVHSYDLFHNPSSIKPILINILITPETMMARDLLKMFIQSRKHAAVVVDEFGGTSGMITLEDLIEEIVGEINDEFDQEHFVEKILPDHEFLFSARLEIDYLNDKYKFQLPVAESYTTLAGLIIHHTENIPSIGEQIIIAPFTFTIILATETRIEQVRMKIESR